MIQSVTMTGNAMVDTDVKMEYASQEREKTCYNCDQLIDNWRSCYASRNKRAELIHQAEVS